LVLSGDPAQGQGRIAFPPARAASAWTTPCRLRSSVSGGS